VASALATQPHAETQVAISAILDRAVGALQNARSAAEVLEAAEIAGAAYDAAKRAARIGKAKNAHDTLIAAAYRVQADALEIEAQAKRRLADEYDAAQQRGEVGRQGARNDLVQDGDEVVPTASDVGLDRRVIQDARLFRNAEKIAPGFVARTSEHSIAAGEEPTRAKLKRAALEIVNGPTPERSHDVICQRVRDGISSLHGLPNAAEVAKRLKSSDHGIIVDERVSGALAWLQAFNKAWEAQKC
jgi:hypothetical protein